MISEMNEKNGRGNRIKQVRATGYAINVARIII